jgi:hypothetical protein
MFEPDHLKRGFVRLNATPAAAEEFGECDCPDCQALKEIGPMTATQINDLRERNRVQDEIAARQALQEINRREAMKRSEPNPGDLVTFSGLPPSYPTFAQAVAGVLQSATDDELLAELRRRGLNREIGAERVFPPDEFAIAGTQLESLAKGDVARLIGMRLLADEQMEFTTIKEADGVTVRASFRFVRMTKRPPRGQGER